MLSSIQIHNKIVENRAKLDAAEKSFNAAEGDAKDIYRDTINQIKGENKSLDEQLAEALDYEDKIRQGGGIPLADPQRWKQDQVQAQEPRRVRAWRT